MNQKLEHEHKEPTWIERVTANDSPQFREWERENYNKREDEKA